MGREAGPELAGTGSRGERSQQMSHPQGAWTLPYLQPGAASRRRERQAAAEQLPFPSRLTVWLRADQLPSGLAGAGGLTGDLTGLPALIGGRVLTTSPPCLAFSGIRAIYAFSHYHLLG